MKLPKNTHTHIYIYNTYGTLAPVVDWKLSSKNASLSVTMVDMGLSQNWEDPDIPGFAVLMGEMMTNHWNLSDCGVDRHVEPWNTLPLLWRKPTAM